MAVFQDLTGMTFGRLTVLKRVENSKNGHARFLCRCDCGNETIVSGDDLKRGHSQSCGCLNREKISNKKHGMTDTKIYHTWKNMIGRCYNQKRPDFNFYGGRGIRVCERWHEFSNFYEDVSQMENYGKPGYTLDRINVDDDYCPENCRWADRTTQTRNRRNTFKVEYNGLEMPLAEAAEKIGINYNCLKRRYYQGDRGERLFRPIR